MAGSFTHLDSAGRARMVDIGGKTVTARSATAEGFVRMQPATLKAIAAGAMPKGDVLAAARIAGILAAKRTGELIPLCHPLPIESANVQFELPDKPQKSHSAIDLRITATATITAKTGVEMEALTAVSLAALTIYDMCKSIDRSMVIHGIRLIAKTGGRSGSFSADAPRSGKAEPIKASATGKPAKRRRK